MNKKIIKKIIPYLIISLVLLWILLAFVRTAYNFTKVYSEELNWIGLSEDVKKEKIFGDLYVFLKVLDNIDSKSNSISIITNDSRMYYFNKYILYPRKTDVFEMDKADLNKVTNLKSTVGLFVNTQKQYLHVADLLQRKGYKKSEVFTGVDTFGGVFQKYD